MGFNKRFVSKDTIDKCLKNNDSLVELFKADAFIVMDEYSSKVFNLFNQGMSDAEIKIILNENKS